MLTTEGPISVMAAKQQQSGHNNHNNVTVMETRNSMNGFSGIIEKSNYQDNHGNNNDFNNANRGVIAPCFCSTKSDYNCSCSDARQMKQRANTTVSVMTEICKVNMDDSMETEHIFAEDGGDDGKKHRYMSSQRFVSFSDAVFATVTTFMIVPVIHAVADYNVNEHLTLTLQKDWFRFAAYGISFLVVHGIWEQHLWIFESIKHVGDTALILNVLLLLMTTLLPFLATLMGDFYHLALPTQLLGGCILLISIIQGVMIAIAYRSRKMLTENSRGDQRRLRMAEFLLTAGFQAFFAASATVVSQINLQAAWGLILATLASDWLSAVILSMYKQCFSRLGERHGTCFSYLHHKLVSERFNKERVQNFTDGVFTIVATILILDITSAAVHPEFRNTTNQAEFWDVIQTMGPVFLSYMSTFITIGMLWYVNFSVFHHVQKVNRIMMLCNKLALLCIAIIPFGYELISHYAIDIHTPQTDQELNKYTDTWDRNEHIAIQVHCAILFCATLCQVMSWLSGHWKRHKHMDYKYRGLHVTRLFCLLMVYPTASLALFFYAFREKPVRALTIQLVELCLPCVFVVMKIVFEVLFHKKEQADKSGAGHIKGESEPSLDETGFFPRPLPKVPLKETCESDQAMLVTTAGYATQDSPQLYR